MTLLNTARSWRQWTRSIRRSMTFSLRNIPGGDSRENERKKDNQISCTTPTPLTKWHNTFHKRRKKTKIQWVPRVTSEEMEVHRPAGNLPQSHSRPVRCRGASSRPLSWVRATTEAWLPTSLLFGAWKQEWGSGGHWDDTDLWVIYGQERERGL